MLRAKLCLYCLGGTMLLGCIYPIMMWFEYDINVFKPRMSEYLKNRFK
jgi:hypothetical protein